MEQKNISPMLEDVRKAHRLLFQYQKRVLSLMKEIREVYGFPSYPTARKRFSDALRNTETFNGSIPKNKKMNEEKWADNQFETYREANLLINGKWAWDFLYTYEMEYYFGMKKKNGQRAILSVFQVTDNGFYMKDGYEIEHNQSRASKTSPQDFWEAKDSKSYFIFACECSTGSKRMFLNHPKTSVQELYGKDEDSLWPCPRKDESVLIARRYPMERCFDQQGVWDCLDDFADFVRQECGFELK